MPESSAEGERAWRFAGVLNDLFAHQLNRTSSRRDRPYTLREVAQATGISIGYLSEARRGNIGNPSLDKIELLARFFGVSPGIFLNLEGTTATQGPPDAPALQAAFRAAQEDPLLSEIVLRAGALSDVERSMILEIMDKVEGLTQWGEGLAARPQPAAGKEEEE